MAIKIISDSSCDISLEAAKKADVELVPFYVSFDGQNYKKELYEIERQDFYEKMVENPKVFPKTSLPSIQDYVDVFTKYAAEGQDIICLTITNKLSGSFNSASNAAEIVMGEYPGVKITAVNSMANTVLQGLLVKEVIRMRDAGLTYEQIMENIERIRPTQRIIFTIGGIDYLLKGGRIGKVLSGAVAKFHVMPVITFTDGEIFPSGICRTRQSSLNKVVEKFKDYIVNEHIEPEDYSIAIGYGYDIDEAVEFKKHILDAAESVGKHFEIEIERIGCTTAVHTGPQALGLGFVRKYDAI